MSKTTRTQNKLYAALEKLRIVEARNASLLDVNYRYRRLVAEYDAHLNEQDKQLKDGRKWMAILFALYVVGLVVMLIARAT